MPDSDHEEPNTDVTEQNQPATSGALGIEESDEPELPGRIPLEADPADTAEQAREVRLDDDEYR